MNKCNGSMTIVSDEKSVRKAIKEIIQASEKREKVEVKVTLT